MTYTPSQQQLINQVNKRIAEGLPARTFSLEETAMLLKYLGTVWTLLGERAPGTIQLQADELLIFGTPSTVHQIMNALDEPPDIEEEVARRLGTTRVTWYLRYQTDGAGGIAIIRYWRLFDDPAHPSRLTEKPPQVTTQATYDILEQGQDKWGNTIDFDDPVSRQRIADRVVFNSDYDNPLMVTNPAYIFSYDDE